MDDRISELSDEILSYILTMLSIKDLLKTSVLSKRWCKLWSLRKDLHFDIFHVLGMNREEVFQTGNSSSCNSIMKRRRVHLDINMDEFVKRVDQVVKSFQGIKIDSFFVSFYLNGKHSDIIDQWIRFAIARGVETINLVLIAMPSAYGSPYKLRYKFAFDLFSDNNASTLKHVRLEHCVVCHPTNCDYIPFKNLRSLSLFRAKVDEILIESLLSNCRRLEELHLFYCEFRSSMPKIISSSLCHLKVGLCYIVSDNCWVNINLISLDCLKLTSLDYHSLEYSLATLNINTPLLKTIHCTVHSGEDPNEVALFATLPNLEIMKLDIYSMVLTSLKITQPFKYLKQLNIILFSPFETVEHSKFNLSGILTLLRASPLLHKLSVMLTCPKIIENQKVVKDIKCTHDEVKVIELRGCVGNWYEIEFVMNVLKYAHKLEQIVLNPYWRVRDSLDWKFDPVWFQDRRQMISEKLQSENVVGREKLVLI